MLLLPRPHTASPRHYYYYHLGLATLDLPVPSIRRPLPAGGMWWRAVPGAWLLLLPPARLQ
jgi:hypothetical protein